MCSAPVIWLENEKMKMKMKKKMKKSIQLAECCESMLDPITICIGIPSPNKKTKLEGPRPSCDLQKEALMVSP
jgi:hypothetical protein